MRLMDVTEGWECYIPHYSLIKPMGTKGMQASMGRGMDLERVTQGRIARVIRLQTNPTVQDIKWGIDKGAKEERDRCGREKDVD